jgi:hypothetical protein
VLGAGVALQYLSPRVTLLIFAAVVALGILAAAPSLLRDDTTAGDSRAQRQLSAYLNDQLVDQTRHLDLVKRAAAKSDGTPDRAFLELLSWELEEDRDILVKVMGRLGVRRSRPRLALAWISGRAARPTVELESLRAGIDHKVAMWNALGYHSLAIRADRQADAVEGRGVFAA